MRQALPFPRIGGGIMSGQYGREAQVWSGDFSLAAKKRPHMADPRNIGSSHGN
jgi:hypothetical protein